MKVVGYLLQQNYGARLRISCRKNGVHIEYPLINIDHLVQFVKHIVINDSKGFKKFTKIHSKFRRLRQIEFQCSINASQFSELESTLSRLQVLHFNECKIKGNFHADFLALCPNLKQLCITKDRDDSNPIIIGDGNDWLHHEYPTLENLELGFKHPIEIKEMKNFLELNPNIKTFATTKNFLWANKDWISTCNVKLDHLSIHYYHDEPHATFNPFHDFLNKLYDSGFYKRLQFFSQTFEQDSADQELFDKLDTLNGLVKLHVSDFAFLLDSIGSFQLSRLHSIEELNWQRIWRVADMQEMAKKLINLRRIEIQYTFGFEAVEILIRQAPQLKEIIVENVAFLGEDSEYIDLNALNEEREKFPDTQRITLYVDDAVYLKIKWTSKETNLPLVRVLRWESCIKDKQFNASKYFVW